MSIQRQFQRHMSSASGRKHGKVLEAFNDTARTHFLHATKGFRRISAKRTAAGIITNEMKNGQMPFGDPGFIAKGIKILVEKLRG